MDTASDSKQLSTVTIFTDGGSRGNPGPAAIGVVVYPGVVSPTAKEEPPIALYEHSATMGIATNNEAEYKAIQVAVEWTAKQDHIETVLAYLDSKLVVEQVNGNWKVKQDHLRTFVEAIQNVMEKSGKTWNLKHIPREQNSHADALVNRALDAAA